MGESLKTPSKQFIKHLEDNGFKKTDTYTYKGVYLGKEVSISLLDTINGHYKELMLNAVFIDAGNDVKQYYKSLCNKIRSEHSGFEEEKVENDSFNKMELFGENGSMITVSCDAVSSSSMSVGAVIAIFKTELVSEKESREEELPDKIDYVEQ